MKMTKRVCVKKDCSLITPGMLMPGLLAVLCAVLIPMSADAKEASNHAGWYYGMAYIAEKEIEKKELRSSDNNELRMAATAGDVERKKEPLRKRKTTVFDEAEMPGMK